MERFRLQMSLPLAFLATVFLSLSCVCNSSNLQKFGEGASTAIQDVANIVETSAAETETARVHYATGNSRRPRVSYIYVPSNVTQLNLRTGPGTNFDSIGYLTSDEYYDLVDSNSLWVQINTSLGEGWAYSEYVEVVGTSSMPDPYPQNVIIAVDEAIHEVPELWDKVDDIRFGVKTLITGHISPVDLACTAIGQLVSRNDDPKFYRFIESGDFACVWLGPLIEGPIGFVPILLRPHRYVDPWLNHVNEFAWSMPITCFFFPNAAICS